MENIREQFAAWSADQSKDQILYVLKQILSDEGLEGRMFDHLNVENQLRGLPWGGE